MATYHCTLAKKYDPDKHDVIGWSWSEKVDGVRALWCPKRKGFFSRSDKPLFVPRAWMKMMDEVKIPLDGEFFMGRGRFQDTVSAVRKKKPSDEDFEGVQYVVFDSLTEGPHSARLIQAMAAVSDLPRKMVYVLEHHTVESMYYVGVEYTKLLKVGGEGIMFRNPTAGYEKKRTGNLLKWKDVIDGTALVTGYDSGKGKHEGRVGALVCVDDETRVTFRVGTGLSDEERAWWKTQFIWMPTGGKLHICWRAMEWTRDGIPRHPVYMGLHEGD